jgi:hypothetical protein
VGPNPYIAALLYVDQTVLCGIHGLYPLSLTLEQQASTRHVCTALDLSILTNEADTPHNVAAGTPGYAFSYAVL